MKSINRIYLIGYMGSGKTTIGKRLARKLELQFVDTDRFMEYRYRKTIGEIFSEKGETAFRLMEHNVLQEVSEYENVVISTGGGAPCFHNNIDLMNQTGFTVYLKVSVGELMKRLETGRNVRPLLKNKTKEELRIFIAENIEKRSEFYNQAQLIFNADQTIGKINIENMVDNLILFISNKVNL